MGKSQWVANRRYREGNKPRRARRGRGIMIGPPAAARGCRRRRAAGRRWDLGVSSSVPPRPTARRPRRPPGAELQRSWQPRSSVTYILWSTCHVFCLPCSRPPPQHWSKGLDWPSLALAMVLILLVMKKKVCWGNKGKVPVEHEKAVGVHS